MRSLGIVMAQLTVRLTGTRFDAIGGADKPQAPMAAPTLKATTERFVSFWACRRRRTRIRGGFPTLA